MKKNIPFLPFFELNEKAQVRNQWFGRTVIHSDQRFAYEEAQYIIESNTKNLPIKFQPKFRHQKLEKNIKYQCLMNCGSYFKMDELAKILRRNRMSDGAISFDKVEVKFNFE
jgi:ribonuclease R